MIELEELAHRFDDGINALEGCSRSLEQIASALETLVELLLRREAREELLAREEAARAEARAELAGRAKL